MKLLQACKLYGLLGQITPLNVRASLEFMTLKNLFSYSNFFVNIIEREKRKPLQRSCCNKAIAMKPLQDNSNNLDSLW